MKPNSLVVSEMSRMKCVHCCSVAAPFSNSIHVQCKLAQIKLEMSGHSFRNIANTYDKLLYVTLDSVITIFILFQRQKFEVSGIFRTVISMDVVLCHGRHGYEAKHPGLEEVRSCLLEM